MISVEWFQCGLFMGASIAVLLTSHLMLKRIERLDAETKKAMTWLTNANASSATLHEKLTTVNLRIGKMDAERAELGRRFEGFRKANMRQ